MIYERDREADTYEEYIIKVKFSLLFDVYGTSRACLTRRSAVYERQEKYLVYLG